MKSLGSIHGRLAQLEARANRVESLPAGYVDPITKMLRAQVAAGAVATPTTPDAIEACKAALTARLEAAGRATRSRVWS